MEEPTGTVAAASAPHGELPTLLIDAPGHRFSVRLRGDETTIGSAASNDIGLDSPAIAPHQAAIRRVGAGWQIVDLAGGEGLWIAGRTVTQAPLSEGGSFDLPGGITVTLQGTAAAAFEPAIATDTVEEAPPAANQLLHPEGAARLVIGRNAGNDLTIDSTEVSRHHAVIQRSAGDQPWTITNLDPRRNTYVNDTSVGQRELSDGDTVRIGPFRLTLRQGEIEYYDERSSILLEALDLVAKIGRKKTILQEISLAVQPHEFVAIVGVSGAGKTTLLHALSGFRPATKGQVLLNGVSLYDNFSALRSRIGYVPQDDIIHLNLTVEGALRYAAELRMPADTTKDEREARLDEVIRELDLVQQRKTRVSNLSGGQRKRVSIGVELLAKPPLFFLDEPTSGLDPSTGTHMMALLRELANEGRTVLLVTHATRDIALCDRVLFLTRGGRMAFFGKPNDALQFFGVEDFEDIYSLLEEKRSPLEWEQGFKSSRVYEEEVAAPLARTRDAVAESRVQQRERTSRAAPGRQRTDPGLLRQFSILTRRYANIVVNDRKQLLILLGQAPIFALLLWALFNADVYVRPQDVAVYARQNGQVQRAQRDPVTNNLIGVQPGAELFAVSGSDCESAATTGALPPNCHSVPANGNNPALKAAQLAFLLAAIAVWLGTFASIREIAKEDAIYRRERAINLRVIPYILSKVAVLFVLIFLQATMLIGVVAARIEFPQKLVRFDLSLPQQISHTPLHIALPTGPIAGIWLSLLLAGAASVAVGLAVSAAFSSADRAVVAAPLLMIPQILFCGGLSPVQDLGPAQPLAAIVAARWAYEAIGRVSGVVREAIIPEQFPYTRSLDGQAYTSWLILAGFVVGFGFLALVLQRLKDRR